MALAVPGARAGDVIHVRFKVNDYGGDRDGYPEPGERFKLRETVLHRPPAPCGTNLTPACPPDGGRTSVDGAIGAPGNALAFSRATSPFPDLAEAYGEGTNRRAFVGRVVKGALCGRFVPMSLLLASDQGRDTVPFKLPIGAPGPVTSRTSAHVPRAIPDNKSSGVNSPLTIPTAGPIRDIDVRVDSITHTGDSQLYISLYPPGGASGNGLPLSWNQGGSGDNYTHSIFDDEARKSTYGGTAPFTGRFTTGGFLKRLYGTDQKGTWALHVFDIGPGNTGTIRGWGLDIRTSVCAVAPKARFRTSRAAARRSVTFDASGSTGDITSYRWDLDGDGAYEKSSGTHARVGRTYADARAVQVGLEVTDAHGNRSYFRRTLKVHAR